MKRDIDLTNVEESDIIVNHSYQRFTKGLGTTIFCIGLSGTGKSSVSLRLGELISTKIHGENRMKVENIVDSLIGLLGFVRNAKQLGEVCVVEEVSVLFPSRRAMAKENVAIGKIMDTIRKKQIILIANAPLLLSMDSHMRSMGNILVETLKINKRKGIVVSKALRLQTNPRSGKTYLHRFRRNNREVHRIYTTKPNAKMWKVYEEQKDRFMDDLYEKLKFEAEIKDKKLLKDMGKIKPKLALTANEMMAYQLVVVRKLTHQKAADTLGVCRQRIGAMMKNIALKSEIPRKNSHSHIANDPPSAKSILGVVQ